ncbi:hypothetical protein T492DRAFT_865739 [Pavlovales sp. CCMP2436]|nr:hypothetical protein T492DRAFT_865739 [Pavlovales sp. CCMP2436]
MNPAPPGRLQRRHRLAMRRAAQMIEERPLRFSVDPLSAGLVSGAMASGSAGAHPHVTDLRFHRWGELLAACSSTGALTLHTFDQLVASASGAPAAAATGSEHKPIFAVSTPMRARALRWSPQADNLLLCAFSSAGELRVFDVAVASSTPKHRCVAPNCSGLFDAEFSPVSDSIVYGGGRDGLLRVWDLRRGSKPVNAVGRGVEERLRPGSIQSIAVEADGQGSC